jgi:hypothetical protein
MSKSIYISNYLFVLWIQCFIFMEIFNTKSYSMAYFILIARFTLIIIMIFKIIINAKRNKIQTFACPLVSLTLRSS